jgi:deazaflavin-dependent oxidoreductase (nitroreductase family)
MKSPLALAKDSTARIVTSGHKALFRVSNGRLLGSAGGMPVVELATIGRKSGQRRTTMLTSPLQLGDAYVLIASYGGDDRHPQWFLNLQANPDVEVTVGGHTLPMRARVASSEERAELWPRVVERARNYGGYQKRTSREIPVVIVEPRPGA